MNEIKKELLKTLDVVTKIKQRIISDVEQKIEQPHRKQTNKLLPILITAIIVMSVIFITPKLLQTEQVQQTATVPKMDPRLYELEQLRQLSFAEGTFWEEHIQSEVDRDYATYLLMDIYAKDHNIKVTEQDIQAAKEQYLSLSVLDESSEKAQMYEEIHQRIVANFEKNGYSEKDLLELYESYTYPKLALQNKLLEKIEKQYTKFKSSTHNFILSYLIQSHLIEKDEDYYYEIMDVYPFEELRFGASIEEAVVIHLTEQALVVLTPNPLMTQHVRWIPRLPGWDFKVGDAVKVFSRSSYDLDENEVENEDVYRNVTHATKMQLLEENRSVRFEVQRNTLQQYFDQLFWQPAEQKPNHSPQYVVTDGLHTYNGYVEYETKTVTWYYGDRMARIPIEKTTQILLQLTN